MPGKVQYNYDNNGRYMYSILNTFTYMPLSVKILHLVCFYASVRKNSENVPASFEGLVEHGNDT
jgi:hypothetical protein